MNIKKLQQLGVVLVGAFVVSGCPSPTASNFLASSSSSQSQEAVAQELIAQEEVVDSTVTDSAADAAAVNYDVCAAVDSWQRPSDEVQAKRLGANARYEEAIADSSTSSSSSTNTALKAASVEFWDHPVISFTTYGLSARVEPETLSGVWTASEDLRGCYGAESVVAINEGDRAEAWLLNHRISSLQWAGDRYVMTVEPAAMGLQVVQFDRVESTASLPLEVVNESGRSVAVTSGDWQ